jgi:hypothetical protein
MFDFVNNYFILFYIGYLRSIQDPFFHTDASCEGPTCMPELSRQITAVFTTKMMVQQTMEIVKPMIAGKLAKIKYMVRARPRGGQAPFAFSTVNRVCAARLYGRARPPARNGGCRRVLCV